MRYAVYVEQKHTPAGIIEAQIWTEAQAAVLGYRDGETFQLDGCTVHIMAFDCEDEAIRHLANQHNCILLN